MNLHSAAVQVFQPSGHFADLRSANLGDARLTHDIVLLRTPIWFDQMGELIEQRFFHMRAQIAMHSVSKWLAIEFVWHSLKQHRTIMRTWRSFGPLSKFLRRVQIEFRHIQRREMILNLS
jgi:hypothetical protein